MHRVRIGGCRRGCHDLYFIYRFYVRAACVVIRGRFFFGYFVKFCAKINKKVQKNAKKCKKM